MNRISLGIDSVLEVWTFLKDSRWAWQTLSTLCPQPLVAIAPEHQPQRQLVTWTEQTQQSQLFLSAQLLNRQQQLYLEFPHPGHFHTSLSGLN